MANQNLAVFGYMSMDYLYTQDLNYFKGNHSEEAFLPGEWGDTKLDIKEGTASDFSDFLSFSKNRNIAGSSSGGGGENSRKGLHALGVPYFYFDTCMRPEEGRGLNQGNSYFAGLCHPGMSLVIPASLNGGGVGTYILKSGRGDLNLKLGEEVTQRIDETLEDQTDVLINSISNQDLAKRIARNRQRGDLYSVITTYIPKNSEAMKDLLRSSRVNFFSLREFYWVLDNDEKYQKLIKGGLDREKVEKVTEDMRGFADEQKIIGSLMVTLGEYGAIHCYRNNGKNGLWVHLRGKVRRDIQEFLKKQGKSTNTAGDKFSAGAVQSLRQKTSLEQAVIDGSVFAIGTVLEYPESVKEEFVVEKV